MGGWFLSKRERVWGGQLNLCVGTIHYSKGIYFDGFEKNAPVHNVYPVLHTQILSALRIIAQQWSNPQCSIAILLMLLLLQNMLE